MNRKYTRELYLDKVAKLRDTCPAIGVTSDMIVGCPGETQADFEDTLDLIRAVQFDGLFAFKYSDRPNAPAARFPDKISQQQKNERLQSLLRLQEGITKAKNRALVGSTQQILVDGLSKKAKSGAARDRSRHKQWTGRTSANKIVNFFCDQSRPNCPEVFPGKLADIRIEKAFSHSLWGKPATVESQAKALKGVEIYAA